MPPTKAGKQRRACSDALGRLVEVDEPNPTSTVTTAAGQLVISGSEQSLGAGTAGTGSVTLSGAESSECILDPCPPNAVVWDGGTVSITVNGVQKSASYSRFVNNTASLVAAALRDAFHNDTSAPVDASCTDQSCSNPVIALTARTPGSSTNYSLNVSSPTLSYTATRSGATLTGGHDPSQDTGSVSATLNGTVYSVNFGGGDTTATIASRLAAAMNGSPVATAVASGNQVNLTSRTAGLAGNTTLSVSYSWNSGIFAQPSFTATALGVAGGYDAGQFDNSPYRTIYSYDALGNLVRVDQKGSAPTDSTQWRSRTFVYDSFSRLLTATNPESGTITYTYDADGELLQKTSPAPNPNPTPPTQSVSYCYDELHRVTMRDYQAHTFNPPACPITAPVVSYVYDVGANAIGHLTSLTDQAGTATYAYDILGRMTTETRTLIGANNASIPKTVSYEYNLDGSLYKLHYPSGAVVTYTPDSAGRTVSAVDSGSGINYVTGASYGPDSALTGFVSGSGGAAAITSSFTYNKRLQPLTMSATAPSQTVFSIGYDFHAGNGTAGSGTDNGNVYGITNYKDTTHGRDQTFTYDALNRLISAQNAGTNCATMVLGNKTEYWGNSYGYDAWGNLLQKNVTKCGAENLSVTADAHNWLHASGTDYQYDAAGNMTRNVTPTVQAYTYDEENRLTGAAGYTYTYDGDGNRVRKSNGNLAANGTLYWYMTPGVVAETDLAGTTKSEYIFFDGERVARKDFSGSTTSVAYYFSDHLKTASVITDAGGVIKAESDYYPWGGELQFVNNDTNDYKFTGKKRDTETGLDYFGARYYSNGLGRWVSADWSATPVPVPYADFYDPQTLNLYQFVGGNPASKADPDGHNPLWYAAPIIITREDINHAVNRVADFLHFATHEYQPHAGAFPPPQPCTCPSQQKQDNSKQNNNNSQSKNTSDVQANRKAGLDTQKQALEKEGLKENTKHIEATDPKTGKTSTTVPDAVRENGQTVEVKDVKQLSDSPQLRRQSEISAQSGQKGQVILGRKNESVSNTVKTRMDVKKSDQ
jgi:RHS repeat-associated protein